MILTPKKSKSHTISRKLSLIRPDLLFLEKIVNTNLLPKISIYICI